MQTFETKDHLEKPKKRTRQFRSKIKSQVNRLKNISSAKDAMEIEDNLILTLTY